MIVKISRGAGAPGLMVYLFGPGREPSEDQAVHRGRNVHEDMRVIAADAALGLVDGQRLDAAADRAEVLALGARLEFARTMFDVDVPGGHVWHCSLSLPAGEELVDEQWAEVAREAMADMGFTEASGKSPCRWIAVHHGASATGNDHIHLAVCLVRADGTRASIWNDRRTMSRFAARMERRFGLHVVEGRAGAGAPGLSRAELERAASTSTTPERVRLAVIVRGHAAASADEAEFARRLRGDGQLLARPRFAAGGRDVVVGYSVALAGEKPLWFGGGRLASDLALPKLRMHWPQASPGAVAAWSGRGAAGPEARRFRAEAWPAATAEVRATADRLAGLDPADAAAWAGAARELAGVLAALAEWHEPGRAHLVEACDMLAGLSRRRHGQAPARRTSASGGLRGVAMVCRQASRTGVDDATAALIAAIFICAAAVARARVLTERAAAAERRLADVQERLALVTGGTGTAGSVRATRAAAARSASPDAAAGPGQGAVPALPPRPPARRPGPDRGFGR